MSHRRTPAREARLQRIAKWFVAALSLLAVGVAIFRWSGSAHEGTLVRADPRFDRLFSAESKVERLASGFGLAEGPAWDKKRGYLLFSDLAANAIYKWQPGVGLELFLQPSGYSGPEPFEGAAPGSNGLAFDAAGRLVVCEHGNRRLTRLEPDGRKTVLAERYQGKRLNSPNDLVFGSKGELYFTDPPFGLPKWFDDPRRELAFSGVYRLSPDGNLELLARDVKAPNGIALSPSEETLYLSDSDENQPAWIAYALNDRGALINRRVFADTPAWARGRAGARDGMKVDRAGNVFASGPGGIHVFAVDGAYLGSIKIERVTNLAWGDDGSVLYITSSEAVYRIQTLTRGARF